MIELCTLMIYLQQILICSAKKKNIPIRQLEKSQRTQVNKKLLACFLNKSQFSNFKKKQMHLKLFELLEQFMVDTFLIKLTQFEKTGSTSKSLIPLGNLKVKFSFRNQNSVTFLVNFTF